MGNSVITVKCNKQSWFSFLGCFFLCLVLLCCLALLTSKNTRVIYFAKYKYPFTFQDSPPLFTTQNFTHTTNDPKGIVEEELCSGRYIYVHDLPSRFNTDIIKNCSSLIKWFEDMCPYISNMGLGPRLINSRGVLQGNSWYVTNQFMLEIIFHNRMKQYRCLTKNSSLASAIYVPFYAGLDIGRYLWGFDPSTRDSASIHLLSWLTKKPEWDFMKGKDHFLVAGRVTWDFRRKGDNFSDWGNKLIVSPEAKNMTILIIESCPWCDNRDVAIPYPTYFHPSTDLDVYEWQNKVRGAKRQYLYAFVGAPRPKLQDSIRSEIIDQCFASKEKCKWFDCSSGVNNCDDPIPVMGVFQSSNFCLQPPGDSSTRRSTFDSIMAGCIPVFFDPGSAYTQYLWHLPKNYTNYSVFIQDKDIKEGRVKIEEILGGISEEQVLAMREEVVRLIPRVMYANPTSRLDNIEDAFDIAIKRVLDKVEKVRREMKRGE